MFYLLLPNREVFFFTEKHFFSQKKSSVQLKEEFEVAIYYNKNDASKMSFNLNKKKNLEVLKFYLEIKVTLIRIL